MRREALAEYLRGALWAMPGAAIVAALAVGTALSKIDIPVGSRWEFLLFQGTADDARTLLFGIASTMVTVIALVLGLTVVALQLASTQFSPRILRNFLRDRVNQLTLSAFMATFAYSTAGLYTVGVSTGQRVEEYPRLAVTGALVLLVVTMIVLVYFVHHLTHSIQVDYVMQDIERGTMGVIAHGMADAGEPTTAPDRPAGAVVLTSPSSGYIQTIHFEALAQTAAGTGVVVAFTRLVGEHVVTDAPVAWAWPQAGPGTVPPPVLARLRRDLIRCVRIGLERTIEQDAAFGVRQLADVASKALSPAINDPYTAIQAVDHLSGVLAELARRPLGHHVVRDSTGTARVYVPGRDWEYFVDLGLGQVRRYGHTEPRVVLALLRVAQDVGYFCDEERRATLGSYVEVLLDDVGANVNQAADREPLLARGAAVLAALAEPGDRRQAG